LEEVNARMAVQSATVADLDRRGAQIDDAVDELTRRGRVTGAMNLASSNERSGTPSRLKAALIPHLMQQSGAPMRSIFEQVFR
jgi:hypothetical protein